jgi:excisionase family DNA binding protein
MPSDDEILTVKELCDLLRLHPSTVYKLVRQDKSPRFRVGNEWRFRRVVIERWTVEQSMNAQQVRKAIDTGVNGEEGASRMAFGTSLARGRGGGIGHIAAPSFFQNTGSVDLRLESTTCSRSRWRHDEVSASVLFLSSRHMVAPRYEGLPGFDGVAYRAPLLRGRARSSEIGFGLLTLTVAISGQARSLWPSGGSEAFACRFGLVREGPLRTTAPYALVKFESIPFAIEPMSWPMWL